MQISEVLQSVVRDNLPDGHIAIDLGFGLGRITGVLLERFEVYGCDLDPKHVQKARSRGVHTTAESVLVWDPPVKAEIITCMELIEHLPAARHIELLNRISRWLEPGGTVMISTPQRISLVAVVERGYHAVRRVPYNWWDPTRIAIRYRRDLVLMLGDAGFTIVRCIGLHLIPQLVTQVVPPLRRYEWSRHEGPVAYACFVFVFVLRRAHGDT